MIEKLLEQLGLKKEDLNQVETVQENATQEKSENVEVKEEVQEKREEKEEKPKDMDFKQLIDYEVLNGRQLFLAKYGHIEDIDKMLPLIEAQAYRDFTFDLSNNKVKGSYFVYLEEAKNKVQKMFEDAYKSFRKFNISYQNQSPNYQKPQEKEVFTTEDLFKEYIKNLKNMTVKHNRIMHLGWRPRNYPSIEMGALELSQKSEYKT